MSKKSIGGIGFLGILGAIVTKGLGGAPSPYDNAVYAIIVLVAMVLFFALMIWDYCKNSEERLWMRVLTASVTILPTILAVLPIVTFFERLLSKYV